LAHHLCRVLYIPLMPLALVNFAFLAAHLIIIGLSFLFWLKGKWWDMCCCPRIPRSYFRGRRRLIASVQKKASSSLSLPLPGVLT
jgi:hypothetical protein